MVWWIDETFPKQGDIEHPPVTVPRVGDFIQLNALGRAELSTRPFNIVGHIVEVNDKSHLVRVKYKESSVGATLWTEWEMGE